jgi:hypothetical protein
MSTGRISSGFSTQRPEKPRPSPNDGGFVFACDPDLPATDVSPTWRPELVPHAVILVPAPDSFPSARRSDRFDRSLDVAAIQGPDGRHVVLPDRDGAHHLWLRGLRPGAPMAALVPLDDDVLLRLTGLSRLRRRLDGRSAGPVPRAWTITARLRQRLVPMVRALDGHLAGASYREIAEALYSPGAIGDGWKTSSRRGQTIRLVKDGLATMEGGYRKLLRGSR